MMKVVTSRRKKRKKREREVIHNNIHNRNHTRDSLMSSFTSKGLRISEVLADLMESTVVRSLSDDDLLLIIWFHDYYQGRYDTIDHPR